jgi:SAM-dependent methyltransferase
MRSFKQAEQAGWIEKAMAYDGQLGPITAQAIDPALALLGRAAGKRILDLCCGTGDLAARASESGANVLGVDFAPTMIDVARRKFPSVEFLAGDAEALAFEDASFDAVVCLFGLWHLADPDRAIAEVSRVMKPGGEFVFTTWLPRDWDLFEIVASAIKRHGSMEVDLPPAPPPFRFSDPKESVRSLVAQGLEDVRCQEMMAHWSCRRGLDVLDLIYKSIVRIPMLIEAQSPTAREVIKREIIGKSESNRVNGIISMRWPYLLVSAKRA